jgi:hypothetical protein
MTSTSSSTAGQYESPPLRRLLRRRTSSAAVRPTRCPPYSLEGAWHGGGATSRWREEDIEVRRRPAPAAYPGEQFCTYVVGQRAHPGGVMLDSQRYRDSAAECLLAAGEAACFPAKRPACQCSTRQKSPRDRGNGTFPYVLGAPRQQRVGSRGGWLGKINKTFKLGNEASRVTLSSVQSKKSGRGTCL